MISNFYYFLLKMYWLIIVVIYIIGGYDNHSLIDIGDNVQVIKNITILLSNTF